MGCVIDLNLLSSMCCIHFCNSAALAHMNTLESTIGPGWKREQHKSDSVFYSALPRLSWTISTDLPLISNMCGGCDVSGSRETAWKVSPERGRMPCEIRDDKDKDKTNKKKNIFVCHCASASSKRLLCWKIPATKNSTDDSAVNDLWQFMSHLHRPTYLFLQMLIKMCCSHISHLCSFRESQGDF